MNLLPRSYFLLGVFKLLDPNISYFFFLVLWGGVRLSLLGKGPTVCLFYQPRMMDYDEYEAVGGISDSRNRNTRRKPASVSFCPPQIPTWNYPGSNPGCRDGKTATNSLVRLQTHLQILYQTYFPALIQQWFQDATVLRHCVGQRNWNQSLNL
jgi:hypothetical protein